MIIPAKKTERTNKTITGGIFLLSSFPENDLEKLEKAEFSSFSRDASPKKASFFTNLCAGIASILEYISLISVLSVIIFLPTSLFYSHKLLYFILANDYSHHFCLMTHNVQPKTGKLGRRLFL